jgi:hypothetical protein
MRNFIILALQIGFVLFVLAAILGALNYFFRLRLGLKGAEVPADLAIAGLCLLLGLISGGASLFLNRKG